METKPRKKNRFVVWLKENFDIAFWIISSSQTILILLLLLALCL